jgi:hypothetical protein
MDEAGERTGDAGEGMEAAHAALYSFLLEIRTGGLRFGRKSDRSVIAGSK